MQSLLNKTLGGRRGGRGSFVCFRVVMALHIKSMSSPMSSHKIAAYFHRPFETPSVCVCVCCVHVKTCASVRAPVCSCREVSGVQGVRVRCKCAGTQSPHQGGVGGEGGGACDTEGVNWAVSVQEAGYDWMKWRDLVRFGTRHLNWLLSLFFNLSSITLFVFVDQ